jgi:hypothetical protein
MQSGDHAEVTTVVWCCLDPARPMSFILAGSSIFDGGVRSKVLIGQESWFCGHTRNLARDRLITLTRFGFRDSDELIAAGDYRQHAMK